MDFKDIQKANESLKTTNIKGTDYAEVNQRIKAFRMLHPLGRIDTQLVKFNDGVCVVNAKVYSEEGSLLGSGYAYEKENSTFINKTSYLENCETSAVGRALGMLGIGIDTSVASYEEVANAIEQQKSKEFKPDVKAINNYLDVLKWHDHEKELMDRYAVTKWEDLNETTYNVLMNFLVSKVKELKETQEKQAQQSNPE